MYKLKVFYEDTDSTGFVYHANYLKYIERARTQILSDNNLTHTMLKSKFELITVVRSCQIDYLKPAKLDDELEITTSINKKTRISLYIDQKIFCKKFLIIKANVRIVTIDKTGKPLRMPSELYNIF